MSIQGEDNFFNQSPNNTNLNITNTTNSVTIDHLPTECIKLALSYLEVGDLAKCCQINQEWKKMANDERLWEKLVPEEIHQSGRVWNMGVKQYLDFMSIKEWLLTR